ncbi:MAG: hypothetical protein R6U69_06660 [Marinobacter sp.]
MQLLHGEKAHGECEQLQPFLNGNRLNLQYIGEHWSIHGTNVGQLRKGNGEHQERVAKQGDTEKRAGLRAAVQRVDVAEEHHKHQRQVTGLLNTLALIERPLEIEERDEPHP